MANQEGLRARNGYVCCKSPYCIPEIPIADNLLGDARSLSRNRLNPMVIPQYRALDRLRSLVQHTSLQPRFRNNSFLPQHSTLNLLYQQRWKQDPSERLA
jgi:hypothetical protein